MRKQKPIVPIAERSSKAAGFSCICRAQSFYERNPYFKCDDFLAPQMVPFAAKQLIRLKIIKFLSSMVPKNPYTYIIARTKFFDSVFHQSIQKYFDQIVLFCPGYDSKCLRFKIQNTKTKIFEFDVRTTQAAKLRLLQKQKLYIPDSITFSPIDFEQESIKDRLLNSGFKGNKKTLFVLEGAFMVLNKNTLATIFDLFQSITGKESEIVFDHIDKSLLDKNKKLKIVSLLDSEKIEAKYFTHINRKLSKIDEKHYMVHAKKFSLNTMTT